jgi:hypothetical protein
MGSFFPVNFERFTGIGSGPLPYLSNSRSPPAKPGVYHLLIIGRNVEIKCLDWRIGAIAEEWERHERSRGWSR